MVAFSLSLAGNETTVAQSEQSKCSATVLFTPAYVKHGVKYIGAILSYQELLSYHF